MRAAGRSIGARAAIGARDTCNPCNARATIGACDARHAMRGGAAPDTRRAAALTPPRLPLRTRRAAGSRRRHR
ncbi:hypothetical protein DIJ61_28170 [Burkholderia pseudomallei]|nr:hypothetical protein CWD85_36930 [Burkholderia pseudomallei]TOZ35601.1 hypothetical protein DIJ60_32280 [Burkholderia pseudomallei]TPA04570.1 hypothetical protein DIJ61_28170 [Burkholderia pseudomallei]